MGGSGGIGGMPGGAGWPGLTSIIWDRAAGAKTNTDPRTIADQIRPMFRRSRKVKTKQMPDDNVYSKFGRIIGNLQSFVAIGKFGISATLAASHAQAGQSWEGVEIDASLRNDLQRLANRHVTNFASWSGFPGIFEDESWPNSMIANITFPCARAT